MSLSQVHHQSLYSGEHSRERNYLELYRILFKKKVQDFYTVYFSLVCNCVYINILLMCLCNSESIFASSIFSFCTAHSLLDSGL